MKIYSRVEVAGAALVIMQQSKTKFCAGLVHPDKINEEIEELYQKGLRRKYINRLGVEMETVILEAKFTTLKKATEQRDKMYQALASGKTQIKLAP